MKKIKADAEYNDSVKLVSQEDVTAQFGEAMASVVSTDQIITWAKFILTDDKPNENRQRIPAEEFDNLIKTGIYKPVKMALGEIKDGHEDSRPLGVITNLAKEGNKIVALAALWDHERTDDVQTVKSMVNDGKPVNVSWEILYGNSVTNNGVSDLLDTILKAVTIVGMPAYAGRTQLLAVAAKKWSPAYISKLPDTSFLHIGADGARYFPYRDEAGKVDPSRFPQILEEIAVTPLSEDVLKGLKTQVQKMNYVISADASLMELLGDGELTTEEYKLDTKELEGKVSELESKLALANDTIQAKEKELADALALAEDANKVVEGLKSELEPLKEFKLESEKVAERKVKLDGIKSKFDGLGLAKPEEYFVDNADKLLGLDESGLDFMLQEMVAFKSQETVTSEASVKKTSGVPNIPGEISQLSVTDLAAALRQRNKK